MNEIVIRKVSAAELDTCADVIREGFLTVARDFGLTQENCPTNGAFLKVDRLIAERENGIVQYGLFHKGNLIGFMQLEQKRAELYILEKLAVLPPFRHLGYGKLLLDFAKEEVGRLRGSKISIGIIEENTQLKNWYLQHGFVHTGTKVFAHLPFTVGFMEWTVQPYKMF